MRVHFTGLGAAIARERWPGAVANADGLAARVRELARLYAA